MSGNSGIVYMIIRKSALIVTKMDLMGCFGTYSGDLGCCDFVVLRGKG
jgi:hypothetical protein